jgi:hypothetical protein
MVWAWPRMHWHSQQQAHEHGLNVSAPHLLIARRDSIREATDRLVAVAATTAVRRLEWHA